MNEMRSIDTQLNTNQHLRNNNNNLSLRTLRSSMHQTHSIKNLNRSRGYHQGASTIPLYPKGQAPSGQNEIFSHLDSTVDYNDRLRGGDFWDDRASP